MLRTEMVQNNKENKMTSVSPPKGRMLLTALMFVFVCGLSMPARAAHVIDHDKVQGFPDSTSASSRPSSPICKSMTVVSLFRPWMPPATSAAV